MHPLIQKVARIVAIITMTTNQNLLRLMTWLSPVFPTGGFSYSHGLEASIDEGLISSREDLADWIKTLIENGSAWNDCVLLVASFNHSNGGPDKAAELAIAMAGSKERLLETTAQGAAFVKASFEWQASELLGDLALPSNCPLPVAVGAVAGINEIDKEQAVTAYLHAFTSNQIQCALRLMKLGQQKGVWIQKEIEITILQTAARAATSSLDDLGSATIGAEIAAMRHETMSSRIFRS